MIHARESEKELPPNRRARAPSERMTSLWNHRTGVLLITDDLAMSSHATLREVPGSKTSCAGTRSQAVTGRLLVIHRRVHFPLEPFEGHS